MVAIQVAPPARKPRAGGIKSVSGPFVTEPRLTMAKVAWEDSGCALPYETRSGCYDSVFPLVYTQVSIDDDTASYTFTRNDDGTVTVEGDIPVGAAPTGFIAPWFPLTAASETVGAGTVNISTAGQVTYATGPSGAVSFSYATADRSGGVVPPLTFDGVTQYTSIGSSFTAVGAVKCWLGGDADGPSYLQQAVNLLTAGEDRSVETRLWEWAIDATDSATADHLVAAVAAAEEFADVEYVGQPVLLMSRAAAVYASAAGILVTEGDSIRTINGTPVVATGVVPTAVQSSVIVIGQPAVWQSETISYQAPKLTNNYDAAVAERSYEIGVDCNYRHVVNATTMERVTP